MTGEPRRIDLLCLPRRRDARGEVAVLVSIQSEADGTPVLDIREHQRSHGGVWTPSKHGTRVKYEEIDAVLRALLDGQEAIGTATHGEPLGRTR